MSYLVSAQHFDSVLRSLDVSSSSRTQNALVWPAQVMAPLRRYLRISKYSVLECRIYLDNPALAQSWLLNPRHSVLDRVIESVRPLVLPKLREEKERGKKKASKKKSIKDVVFRGSDPRRHHDRVCR